MSACVASHTISRLTKEQQKDVHVTVYNKKARRFSPYPSLTTRCW